MQKNMFMKSNVDTPLNCILSNFISEKRYEIAFEIFKKDGTKLKTDKIYLCRCISLEELLVGQDHHFFK